MFLGMLCNNQNSSDASCPWPHFKCPNIIVLTTSYDGILLDSLPASFRLPHFAYRSTELFPRKTWDPQPVWEICSSTHWPLQVQLCEYMHSISPTKVMRSGSTTSCSVCWNSASAGCPYPHCTCPIIIKAVPVTISRDGILLNTLPASSCSHNLCTCRSAHMIMQIITGGHSTSGKEMQIVVSRLQSTKDGLRPWHGVLLLQIPWGMLKEQDPAELRGKDSVSDSI